MGDAIIPIEIYLCYADADKGGADFLVRHLTPLSRSGKIKLTVRKPPEGGISTEESQAAEATALKQADVILLLVSADLEIDRSEEINAAFEERKNRRARVIPILYRPLEVQEQIYKDLRMLPDGAPIALRRDKDEAWVEVVSGLRRVVETLAKEKTGKQPSVPAQAPTAHPAARPSGAASSLPPVAPPLPLASQPAAATHNGPTQILFLGANPTDMTRLELGTEAREISRRIQSGRLRDSFNLVEAWAVSVGELMQILLHYRPTIVHFSGHGTSAGQLIFQNDQGRSQPVPTTALASLFRILAPRGIRAVVLNACYSGAQAKAVAEYVDCVVGIADTIADSSARAFVAGFYTALLAGENAQTAFALGCVQIELLGLSGAERPVLLCRDPQAFYLS